MTVVEDEPDRGEGHSQLSNSWDRLSMQIFKHFQEPECPWKDEGPR